MSKCLCVQDSSHAEVNGSEKAFAHTFLTTVGRKLNGKEARVAHLGE